MEDPIGQVDRIGRRLAGDCAEVAAGLAKDVTDVAVAVVDAVQDRLGQVHEPPHQVERQIGAGLGHLGRDHLPLEIDVLHEASPFLPIDKGSSAPQRGKALGNVGRDHLRAGLTGQLEAQSSFDLGILLAELEQELGQPSCAETFQGLESGLLGSHARYGLQSPSKR